MALPSELTARRDQRGFKLGNVIRMLSSSSDGDIITTVYALRRMLESCGADIHALADHVEDANGSGLSEAEWTEVALYCQREKHRLDAKHHKFVDDMASRTAWGREPTERQHKYLHSLFFKLGGKIT
jgi:hypothetical protein